VHVCKPVCMYVPHVGRWVVSTTTKVPTTLALLVEASIHNPLCRKEKAKLRYGTEYVSVHAQAHTLAAVVDHNDLLRSLRKPHWMIIGTTYLAHSNSIFPLLLRH